MGHVIVYCYSGVDCLFRGRLAQLGERCIHIAEVTGSRPVSPTNRIDRLGCYRSYFVAFNLSAFLIAIFGSLCLSFSSVISRSRNLLKSIAERQEPQRTSSFLNFQCQFHLHISSPSSSIHIPPSSSSSVLLKL